MTNLSDTQLVILSAASQREDGAVIIPDTLKGGAVEKVVSALARKQLIEVVPSRGKLPVWRESEDGQHLSLKITDKGLEVLGIEAEGQSGPADELSKRSETAAPGADAAASGQAGSRAPREGSKQALLIEMLLRPEGADVDALQSATGWQAHTIRAALSRLRRRGYEVEAQRQEGGTVYRATTLSAE